MIDPDWLELHQNQGDLFDPPTPRLCPLFYPASDANCPLPDTDQWHIESIRFWIYQIVSTVSLRIYLLLS